MFAHLIEFYIMYMSYCADSLLFIILSALSVMFERKEIINQLNSNALFDYTYEYEGASNMAQKG